MFFGNKRRIVSLLLAGCLLYTAEFQVLAADPQSEAHEMQTVNYEIEIATFDTIWESIPAMAEVAVGTQEWHGKALANGGCKLEVYEPNKYNQKTLELNIKDGKSECKIFDIPMEYEEEMEK